MSKLKLIGVSVGLVIIIIAAALAAMPPQNTNKPSTRSSPIENNLNPSTTPTPITSQPTPNGTIFSLAQVAQHADAASCWSVVNGSVYDLTPWISQYPGGKDAILTICGKDGSDLFNGQHTGQERPENMLATFRIGALAQ